MPHSFEVIKQHILSHQTRYLDELSTYLKLPSVSTQTQHKSDIIAAAKHTAKLLQDAGLENITIHETKGHPIVTGDWLHKPNAPTVLIYGHYDVQPAEPLNLWHNPPFEPTIKNNLIYARGASDNKGQIFCHIKAIEALFKTTGKLPVNVKVIIEGEEEIGSPHLAQFLKDHLAELKADAVIVSDSPMIAQNRPSLCIALRGLIYTEITVQGVGSDLHSGQHGGPAPNAIQALCEIITKLKDSQNKITIPEFYDGVNPTPKEVLENLHQLPPTDAQYLHQIQASKLMGESEFTTHEKRWFRPTLECNGIWGGYTQEGSKTVIPALAHAKISMRLVGDQNPDTIIESYKKHLQALTPSGYTITVSIHSKAPAIFVDPNTTAVQAALKALEDTHGVKAVLQGEGGSIPIVREFQTQISPNIVLMGLNLPDDAIHAPNERFGIDNMMKGIEAGARLLNNLNI